MSSCIKGTFCFRKSEARDLTLVSLEFLLQNPMELVAVLNLDADFFLV